jgi:hypothetical protein
MSTRRYHQKGAYLASNVVGWWNTKGHQSLLFIL